MRTFYRANVASVVASASDYAVTIVFKKFLEINPVAASIWGTVAGGVINFFICRHWAFKVSHGAIYFQSRRYFITWMGNLLLNAAGVYLLIEYAGINYIIAKIVTSITVAVAYNYPLQKRYVFKNI